MIKNFPFESEEKQVVWVFTKGHFYEGPHTTRLFHSSIKAIEQVPEEFVCILSKTGDKGFYFSEEEGDNKNEWIKITSHEVE